MWKYMLGSWPGPKQETFPRHEGLQALASTQHIVGTQHAYNFWLSCNANNSPKTRAFVKKQNWNRKSQIPRFWLRCRLVSFRMVKDRVAGSKTQTYTHGPTPRQQRPSKHSMSEWLGGHYGMR